VGKHPCVKWSVHATSDRRKIETLWRARPNSGAGAATGQGVLCLDVDPRHGGFEALERLEGDHGALPQTARVRTGAYDGVRGLHLWFAYPPALSVASRANPMPDYPGIDVRADGGYAVVPPSRHASGVRYEWDGADEFADAPPFLLDLLRTQATERDGGGVARERTERPLSRRMRTYLEVGIPYGEQRQMVCALARALLEVPISVDEASAHIAEALERSEQDSATPWTEPQVRRIVADIDRSPRPALRQTQKRRVVGFAGRRTR